jgi:hypothetical protein
MSWLVRNSAMRLPMGSVAKVEMAILHRLSKGIAVSCHAASPALGGIPDPGAQGFDTADLQEARALLEASE